MPKKKVRCEGCNEMEREDLLKADDAGVVLCPLCTQENEESTEQHYLDHPEDDPLWDELKDCAEAHSLRHVDNVHALLRLVQREVKHRETG